MDRRRSQRAWSPPGGPPGGGCRAIRPEAQHLSFAVQVAPGSPAVITVTGEFDIAAAPAFQAALADIDFPALRRAVLDLSALDFMDATGLRAVLSLHRTCAEHSVALAIVPGPRPVHKVFELTGTDRLLPFRRDRA